ncbi:MAG TPA: hypothetical protein VK956_09610 [Verrucomicrobium sp.]|nr:hypothetical protein [Verrucomicrobium sp.]
MKFDNSSIMCSHEHMISHPETHELVYIISSVPDLQEWVLVGEGTETRFPDRGHGKVPGLVDAIRHCFWQCEGRPSLLLIQHGGQQFRLRFHSELPLLPEAPIWSEGEGSRNLPGQQDLCSGLAPLYTLS